MEPEIIAALIGPALTAGIAGITYSLKEARTRRDQLARRNQELSAATSHVSFTDAWLAAYQKADPTGDSQTRRSRAVRDLEQAYSTVVRLSAQGETAPRARSMIDVLQWIALGDLRSPRAKSTRVKYFIAAAFAVLFLASAAANPQTWAGASMTVNVITMMIATIIFFLPAILLWQRARRRDASEFVSAPQVTDTPSAVQPGTRPQPPQFGTLTPSPGVPTTPPTASSRPVA